MKEIQQAIDNHDCCMRPEILFKAIEQYVIKAKLEMIKELRDRHAVPMNSATDIILIRIEAHLNKALTEGGG